jgi:hypothetical protein
VTALTLAALVACVPSATADFPYGSGPHYKLGPGQTPNDYTGDGNGWKFAATPESGSPYTSSAQELFGVRGAHVVDPSASVDTAWQTTVGRPDVTISVLDSGIKWNDSGAMSDLRKKVRLNKGELPTPLHDRTTSLEPGVNCAGYGHGSDPDDANNDGVFNVLDFACDSRVNVTDSRRVGPAGVLVPQDVTIAFSDGADDDGNGFTDDIAGWDFLDNDNDPYDDVQYGHGTGEAKDSSSEANNGDQAGSCPNCMVIPLRVGDSFVADDNKFAQAVLYAVDNNVLVVQEALGTLNNSHLAQDAIDYAYNHGVAVIASAADEAAQHHNWPSNSSHTIVVNSVNQYNIAVTPSNPSFLQINGCTNFSSHVTLAIPSSSCSSNATGLAAGFAGLVYSAALNARDDGLLTNHPSCQRVNGQACVLTANEVRQIMASGTIDGTPQADDVSFTSQPEPSCNPPAPGCTDPNLLFANTTANRPEPSPIATTQSYPARKGFDEFYGYGRANMAKVEDAVAAAAVMPEAEIASPRWYAQIDPNQPTMNVQGQVYARSQPYTCQVLVAPGSEPNNGLTSDASPGDFEQVSSSWCDGTARTSAFDGTLATVDINHLKSRFPADAGAFNGREPPPVPPHYNNRPNQEPYGFTVKVVVTSVQSGKTLTGQDRRNFYLHHDQDLLPGFPKTLPGDGESSPVFADLDGDNRNELLFGTSDGIVHAIRRDGTELPGWPVHSDALPLHTGQPAFTSGDVSTTSSYGAILTSLAVGDLDRDGTPEVVADDMQGKVYAWKADGSLLWKREANIDFSGKPLQPFVNVRRGQRFRTQHAFIASPVIADLQGNGGPQEVIAANMDRHVYAWDAGGSAVSGFPVLVVDQSKISSVDPQTDAPNFTANAGPELNSGAIIDTPAVGDLDGDGKPEIVVGTNEEYAANTGNEGPYNASNFNAASLTLIGQFGGISFGGVDNPLSGLANVNSRVYAIHPNGNLDGGGPFLSGWPAKVGLLQASLLPVVGEGVTGAPVIGPVTCPSGGAGPKVGAVGNAGPAYIFNPNGQSCYGRQNSQDVALQTDFNASAQKYDTPAIPAVGHPIFANFGGSMSLLMPAAGLIRAFDVVANEYQGGQDFLAAWDASTGQFRPGFPTPVSDLQFLTGPSVADIDGLPGEEALGGTASIELNAFNSAGAPANVKWPKLTSDWTVANPLIGSFGTLDTDSAARKVVVSMTRSGTLFAYDTGAPSCSPGSWPKYHHDPANSGDYSRDASLPGKPYGVSLQESTLSFTAPGDDLLCGTADHYQIVTSDQPITGANFAAQAPLSGAPQPQAAGTPQTFAVPAGAKRYIAIRAVDDQGNVGPPAVVLAHGSSVSASLVPAFKQCGRGGNPAVGSHSPPMATGSCNPSPVALAEVGPQSVGTAKISEVAGDITTAANEADIAFAANVTDVRSGSPTGADYDPSASGPDMTLLARFRMTDSANGVSGTDRGTTTDFDFAVPVVCQGTALPTVGSTCAANTSANAVVPGSATEGSNAIVQVFRIRLNDAGVDGISGNVDDQFFEQQGVFVP